MTARLGDCPPGAAAFVVLAGGSGTRMAAGRTITDRTVTDRTGTVRNKVYLPVGGRPLLAWSLAWASVVPAVGWVILVRRPEDAALADEAVTAADLPLPVEQVSGGQTRHQSEAAALRALAERIAGGAVQVVAVHDGARPLAGPDLLRTVIDTAWRVGGAVPTLPVDDVWQLAEGRLPGAPAPRLLPPDRTKRLHRVQTPQAFRAPDLLAAFAAAGAEGPAASFGTDTAGTVQAHSNISIQSIPGNPTNLKVTFTEDLARAARLLSTLSSAKVPDPGSNRQKKPPMPS